jgi:siderophore synthetase component
VVPTASGRTVIVVDPSPVHYAKLHYPGLLGRVPRELNGHRVRVSVRMSAALDNAASAGSIPDSCAYLAESIGVVAEVDGAEHGVVYREFAPRHSSRESPGAAATLIPFFALFSVDSQSPADPPLLASLLRLWGEPAADALRRLLDLVLESYAALVFGVGLVPEDHGQNLLLQLGPDLAPLRIVRRDLLDWYADLEIRRDRGLPADFVKNLDTAADSERAFGGRSYAFDFRLGNYILKPLVDCAVRHCGVNGPDAERWITDRVHALAARYDVDLRQYFQPFDRTSRFGPGLEIWRDGRPLLIEGPKPVYR